MAKSVLERTNQVYYKQESTKVGGGGLIAATREVDGRMIELIILYKDVKKNYEREEYWDSDIIGNVKEAWAGLRCGNIDKDGKKGYAD